jgi:hypothetical protein
VPRRSGRRQTFAAACDAGDPERFAEAVELLNATIFNSWRLGMMRVAKLPTAISADIRAAFLNVWIESKMLPLRVGDRRTLASALRLLMPCDYSGEPVRLYRGTDWRERRHRRYGFSWTTDKAVARRFAERHAMAEAELGAVAPELARQLGGGVVLEALAPAEAILLMREVEDYYDEGEIVVDPFKLGAVTVAERLRP